MALLCQHSHVLVRLDLGDMYWLVTIKWWTSFIISKVLFIIITINGVKITFNLSCIQKQKTIIYPLDVYAINQVNWSNLSVYCSQTRSDSCHSSPVSTKNFYPCVFTTSSGIFVAWPKQQIASWRHFKKKKNPNKCTENEAGLHYKYISSTKWHQNAYLWVENEGYSDCCMSIKKKSEEKDV